MPPSSFERARSLDAGGGLGGSVSGLIAALFPPMLIVVLGLALQVLVDGRRTGVPRRGPLGALWSTSVLEPVWSEPNTALGGLALAAALLAVLHAAAITWQRCSSHASARRVAAEIKRRIHDQAFQLGSHDALGDERSLPEELFLDKTELVRQGIAARLRALPHAVILLVLLVGLALAVHPWLTLLVLALAALLWRTDAWWNERNGARARRHRERARLMDERLTETLNLAPLATGYAIAELPGGSFTEWLRQERAESYRADVIDAARSPWFWMMAIWSVAFAVLMIGLAKESSVSEATVLVVSLASAYFPLRRLAKLRSRHGAHEHAARDIFHYLDRNPTVRPMPDSKPLAPLRRELRVENVTLFDRMGKKVLDEVSITAPALSRIAVLAGDVRPPRALAGLFPRFYDPVAGRILFDDMDVRWGEVDSVRAQTMLVFRDSLCFTGTVLENLNCGKTPFTADRIHEAAKYCHAIDFILGLPDGFETTIGRQGARLEDSQAFRIALARAVVREPSLLVVEEPDAASSDSEQAAVDAALANAAQGRTLIIVPSRLATLRSADLVVLLHDGKVVAQGTHAELLQSSELYRHLNYVRFHPIPSGGG